MLFLPIYDIDLKGSISYTDFFRGIRFGLYKLIVLDFVCFDNNLCKLFSVIEYKSLGI